MNKIDRLCRDVKRLVNEAAQGEQFKIAIKVVPAYFSIVSHCYSNGIKEPETLESEEGRSPLLPGLRAGHSMDC